MKKKRGELFLAVLVTWFLFLLPCAAIPQSDGAGGPADAAQAAKVEALRHKERGDEFRLRDDIARAGEEFAKALALYRGFSRDDRYLMARYMSWSGRIDDAIRELKAILAEEPGDVDARIHLARCLAWNGDPEGSLVESSKVLAESPDNRDALLVRANALKWRGDPEGAKRIYRRLLENGDDFDTRLGLSYALLATGNVREAKSEAGRLTAGYPYQEKELKNLNAEIAKATRPTLSGGYSYYRDSDRNRADRYTVSAGSRVDNWTFDLGYRHVEADDPTRDERADALSLSVGTRLADRLAIGAGIGAARTGRVDADDFVTGHVRAELRVLGGTIGAAASREVFTDTAQLIENRIRLTHLTGYADTPLPGRITLSARYSYKDYSDSNASHDWQGSLKYAFRLKNPAIGAGYRIRFLDFDRESGSGYFDPSEFLSHAAFVTFYYEKERFRAYLEPYGGYQSFRRFGSRTNSWFGGGSGVLGYRISPMLTLEATGEGGDYAGGTAAGFNYYMVGGRLVATF